MEQNEDLERFLIPYIEKLQQQTAKISEKEREILILKLAFDEIKEIASEIGSLKFPTKPIKIEDEPNANNHSIVKHGENLKPSLFQTILAFKHQYNVLVFLGINELIRLARLNKYFFKLVLETVKRIKSDFSYNPLHKPLQDLNANFKEKLAKNIEKLNQYRRDLTMIKSYSCPPTAAKVVSSALLAIRNIPNHQEWSSLMKQMADLRRFINWMESIELYDLKRDGIEKAKGIISNVDDYKCRATDINIMNFYEYIHIILEAERELIKMGDLYTLVNFMKTSIFSNRFLEYYKNKGIV